MITMTRKSSFPPVYAHNARLLILGSLPGEASLAATPSLRYPIGVSDERSTSFLYGVNAGYGLTESTSLFLGYQGRVGYAPSNSVQVSVRVRF